MVDFVEGTFTSRVAAEPSTPVVVSVPHAGVRTAGFDAALVPELDVRGDARPLRRSPVPDLGEDGGPETYVSACLSRFICDLNRDPDDVSAGAVPEHPKPRNTDGRGFIWAVDDRRHTDADPAADAGRVARANRRPRRLSRHDRPRAGPRPRPVRVCDPGRRPFDAVARPYRARRHGSRARRDRPGQSRGKSCAPALTDAVRGHFERNGFTVRANDPYKGGFITAHHGRPANRIHAIQIEMRRDLYMNEATFTPNEPGVARMQGVLGDLLASLRTLKL